MSTENTVATFAVETTLMPRRADRGLRARTSSGFSRTQPSGVIFRPYAAVHDAIFSVRAVTPALLYGTMVSVDRVSDHWHTLVEAVLRSGQTIHLILSRRGWIPVARLPEEQHADQSGRNVKFTFTTNAPSILRTLALSRKDRERIVAALLASQMGERLR